MRTNKKKIINDPVFGFMTLQSELIFDLIEHPWFQRLRRIKQLGLSNTVFPGANHTRFEHALGAAHLMQLALDSLSLKGIQITEKEAESATIAILLHDIGHGPFSHTLENSIVEGVTHEDISTVLMKNLDIQFDGKLSEALRIFRNQYPKKFLHQMVSSQLDMDRLDYLRRDSFYTGVAEGTIGSDRIIRMLNVCNDELVIEAKGIYSIEQFLISRRLMYWQVYLHKTVLAAEFLLINILKRAKYLAINGESIFSTPLLSIFLTKKITFDFLISGQVNGNSLFSIFAELDDNDILASIKQWQYEKDKVLSYLSICLIARKLFSIEVQDKPFDESRIEVIKLAIMEKFGLDETEVCYLFINESIMNSIYGGDEKINILDKDGKVKEFSEASDINLSNLSIPVRKYIICYPKELDIN